MITGAHAIVFTTDAEADRAFFRDVLGLKAVDAGGGWLIFALPPAEVALHPDSGNGRHQPFLLCDDVEATAAELQGKAVEVALPIEEQDWGRLVSIKLPGGGDLAIYEPKHPLANS